MQALRAMLRQLTRQESYTDPGMSDKEPDLRSLFESLDPKARDDLRRVLVRDQADRDAIASRLMRYRDRNGQDWVDDFGEHQAKLAEQIEKG